MSPPTMPMAGKIIHTTALLKAYGTAMSSLSFLAPLLLAWRGRRGKEDPARRNERLGKASTQRPKGPLAWFHAASVGETNAVLPLILELVRTRPDITILLTTGTVTSARLSASRMPKSVIHQYIPLDIPAFARSFLNHWAPDLALFAESEIWPNLILETAQRNCPLVLINGRMSERSFHSWVKRNTTAHALFGLFDLVLAQSETHAARFSSLGASRSLPAGNLKIDAPPPFASPEMLEELKNKIGKRPVFLAASTHPGEDVIIAKVHHELTARHKNLLTIIVPRHPQCGGDVMRAGEAQGFGMAQRSRGDALTETTGIYVADTIGELGLFYAIAPVAFIGGSLVPHGGQNPVEAIRHECVVIAGPLVHNFMREYAALVKAGGCIGVRSADNLAMEADKLLDDAKARNKILRKGNATIARMAGALNLSLKELAPLLPPAKGKRPVLATK